MKVLEFKSVIGIVKTEKGWKELESEGSIEVPTYQPEVIRCETSQAAELLKKWAKL